MTRAAPDFRVIIPARYASTRLPGKPLKDIAGLPMVVRVARQARKSGAREVMIATDHEAILSVAMAHGENAMLTAEYHRSGTDRLAEVINRLGVDDNEIIVNVQGDEPLVDPGLICAVALNLSEHPEAVMATAAHPLQDDEIQWANPNIVKVVLDVQGFALYFSRALIPYRRMDKGDPPLRHIGVYAYRASFLRAYPSLPSCTLEEMESLEQLRALYHGYRISVHVSKMPHAPGVDTEEELDLVRTIYQPHQSGDSFCE
ncbi:MAG TPA: 3-deoxy-manno-octulosonate cytidylyltransferase [Burkholderiales bacterium]|nr:3-deoxy-manno-octulosonate cytidylyltransferase [Burkholderiales bacterium]